MNKWVGITFLLVMKPGYFDESTWDTREGRIFELLLVAIWIHLSGSFWLFAPKFWDVTPTYEWYFVTL